LKHKRSLAGGQGAGSLYNRPEVTMLEPGAEAPDFAVRDHTGKTVRLSDFRGRPVVLWFYPKADTPG